jgi:hypothetical protein
MEKMIGKKQLKASSYLTIMRTHAIQIPPEVKTALGE